jgi:hypothetical protein
MCGNVLKREVFVGNQNARGLERGSLKKLLQQFVVTDSFLVSHPVFFKTFYNLEEAVPHQALARSTYHQYKMFTAALAWNKALCDSYSIRLLQNFWSVVGVQKRPLFNVPVKIKSGFHPAPAEWYQPTADDKKTSERLCSDNVGKGVSGDVAVGHTAGLLPLVIR